MTTNFIGEPIKSHEPYLFAINTEKIIHGVILTLEHIHEKG